MVGPYLSACKLLACPSKLMRSNLPYFSPLSISLVLVQSHGACLFCWAALSHMHLFYVCPSHQKDLVMKLSINILCPKPSTLPVKCVTVAHVAVMSSVAECESVPKYTVMSYVYPDSTQSLKILMPKCFLFFGMYCLKITLPLNFTITSCTAKRSERL